MEAVPPPRKRLSWQPPVSKWAGRALFFALGTAVFITSACLVGVLVGVALDHVRGVDSKWLAQVAALAAVAAPAVAIVVQRVRNGPRWRWLSYLAGAAALPVLFVVLFEAGPALRGWVKQRHFDPVAWRADTDAANNVRVWMVADLQDRHRLEGLTRAEVEALLGPPNAGTAQDEWIEYVLGHDGRGFLTLGPRLLRLQFGNDGRVMRVDGFGS